VATMERALSGYLELKEMRDNIHRSVNSLELCSGCDRICECEKWIRNTGLIAWLCFDCLSKLPDLPHR
jgi:hypothetical protein